jgi:GT2 family glycosyltransferase
LTGDISVIIPTYSRSDLIGSCLDGLDRQSLSPLEVIVVDQSPDSLTRKAIEGRPQGPAPVRYLHSDRVGVSLARNIGVRTSRGSILAFTEDDAVPDSSWLESLAAALARTEPPAGLVGGRLLPLWEKPKPRWYPVSHEYLLGIFDPGGGLAPFPQDSLPMTGNMAVYREVFDRIRGFNEQVGPRSGWRISGEDSLFAWKAIEAGIPIYYQPEAIVHHRIPAIRMSRRFILERCWREGISLLDIEEKRGILTAERLRGHVRGHRRHVLRRAASLAASPSLSPWNDQRVMESLCYMAISASIVRRGRHLLAQLTPARP